MSDIAERLAEKFGISIEEAKKIADRVVKDEKERSLDPEFRLSQLLEYNCRLRTPGIFAANAIIRQSVREKLS